MTLLKEELFAEQDKEGEHKMTKKLRITKIEEETRRDQIQRGIKTGSKKATVDRGIKTAADPIAGVLKQVLKKGNIQNNVSDKAIETLSEALVGYTMAELISASGSLTEKIPGLKALDKEKMDQIARWMRGHVGDKAGSQTADGMFAVAPIITQLVSNSAAELFEAADIPIAQLTEGTKLEALPDEVPNKKEKKNGKNNS